MSNVVVSLDKIKVNFNCDNEEILAQVQKDFGDFMTFSDEPSEEKLFTVNCHEMDSLKEESGGKVFYDKEPKDKHVNKVTIFDDSVDVQYHGENDYSSFCGYVLLNSMGKLFENSGYFILHSSCIEKDGEAIAFSGKKGAGKTQTLLNLLQNGYNLVTNDKLAVRVGDNDELVCVGFPTTVGIRMTNSFVSDEKNQPILRTLKQKHLEVLKAADSKNLADESKKFFIHPRVITNSYGQDISPISNLVQIVNPTFNPEKEQFESRPADLTELIRSQREEAVSIEKPYLNNIEYTPFQIDMEETIEKMADLEGNIVVEQGPGQTSDLIDVLER